ncbi:hypothetical protein [Siccirubricoccus sp. G192]|uniref:hypothetical protein n=1 Tax=Siccirubricoccus sp. G192 TaxID=2849651 RepID=UPI001C2CA876|nr:hypothetical protein [Siccirubricoccus sp. G192]MBV1799482.1 hypothetical protein [Siccirubricoccus sp. G192]
MRLALLALGLVLLIGGATAAELAGPGWRIDPGDRLRPAGVVNGWTLLRDTHAPAEAEDYGLLLLRVQRPVPPAARAGHLGATLRHLRPFRFGALPKAERIRHGGLPAAVLETSGFSAGTGAALMVRAMAVYAPERSFLLIAAAPSAEWPALREALVRALASSHPTGGRR